MPAQAITFTALSSDAASAVGIEAIPDLSHSTPLDAASVYVHFLAFPINPQDLLAIAGKYPVKPAYTAPDGSKIAGNDGVAIVKHVGDAVTTLKEGDMVLPKRHGLGTWRTSAVFPAEALLRIPSSVDPVDGALLKMGFAPAYLLLEDTVKLRPGSWIIVNAALGVIPQMICQFAHLRGCRVIAVIRSRPDMQAASSLLLANGADMIVGEEDLEARGSDASPALATLVQENRIVLALDAVFGHRAEHLARLLAPGSTFVNYGSLGGSDGVLQLTQELLFWKQITFRNFRLSQQLSLRSDAEVEGLLAWFVELLNAGRLRTPTVEVIEWNTEGGKDTAKTLHAALESAGKRSVGARKTVFALSNTE
jgi:trans-2-enoyl-CoA reductase